MARVSNFPTKPQKSSFNSDGFPSDLPSNFCTTITFTGGGMGAMSFGQVKLPLPKRLNDNQAIIWEEFSLTSMALSFAGNYVSTAVSIGSVATQTALNPFMFMQFKRPTFKEHLLQWTLAPNNQKESDKLKKIITTLKKASLPSTGGFGGALMKYPALANVQFNPGSWLYRLKPCAITGVQIDYTGAGLSFFNSKAPTIVNISLQLKETKLWKSDDPDLEI
jgi:hypothetical protein